MKKMLLLLLTALLLNVGAAPALAENKLYELPELNLTLEIPEGMLVFTRHMAEDDIALMAMGMTPEELRKDFTEKDVYMNAMSLNPIYEVIVTMMEYAGSQEIFDFNTLGDRKLKEMAELLLEGKAAQGKNFLYDSYRIEEKDKGKFMVLDLRQEAGGNTIYGRQYYTIFNGQAINITLQSYTGPISQEMTDTMQGIMDSLRFTAVFENPNKGAGIAKWVLAGLTATAALAGLGMILTSKRRQKQEEEAAGGAAAK